MLIGIVGFGSELWDSEIEKTGELAGRPKTGFVGFFILLVALWGVFSNGRFAFTGIIYVLEKRRNTLPTISMFCGASRYPS